MFGVGLLVRSYSALLFGGASFATIFPGGDITKVYLPQGFMVGAGLVTLIQVVILVMKDDKGKPSSGSQHSAAYVRRSLGFGTIAYVAIAMLLAAFGGLWTSMSMGMLLGFLIYAAFATALSSPA